MTTVYENKRVRPPNSSFDSQDSEDLIRKQESDDDKESIEKSSEEQSQDKMQVSKKQKNEHLKRKDNARVKKKLSSESQDVDSEEQEQKKYKPRKLNPHFLEYLDEQASSDSGQQQQSLNSEQLQEKRKHREKYQNIYQTDKKGPTQLLIDRLKDKSEKEINDHYEKRAKQQDQFQMLEDGDNYMRQDQQLYQIKCIVGQEQSMVMKILNKVEYIVTHPHVRQYYCNIISASSFPKKFPGYVFLEGNSFDDIKKSIEDLKGLKITTLKKIEFQIFTNLFNPIYKQIIDYKVQQYVKIKVGVYTNDLAQITQVHKNGVTVQVIPRVSFETIKLRLSEADQLNDNKPIELITQAQKKKLKQEIFKKLTSHKTSYPEKERPAQKKLSVQDFYQYQDFPHNKHIKLTGEGLLLAKYSFKEIQCPKTTIEPKQILQLNPRTQDPYQLIKNEAVKVKLDFAVQVNDLVQIINGELKGCFGRVTEKLPKIIRIKCMNFQLKDQIVDQIPQYLQKMFKEGEKVLVIEGKKKGEEGMVLKNGKHNVTILTTNDRRLVALKRNVRVLTAEINFKNDLGIKLHDIIKLDIPGNKQMGIVVTVKKNCVDYVSIKNEIKRAMNWQLRNITNHRSNCFTPKNQQVRKNSIVIPISGPKEGQSLAVKAAISNYVFLKDPNETNLNGVWVQPVSNVKLLVKCAPRIQAQFLQRQPWHKSRRYHNNKNSSYKPHPKDIVANSRFKVGDNYLIKEGIYNGVRGVISAAYKSHIEVRVFNTKFYNVPRQKLDENGQDKRSNYNNSPNRNNSSPVRKNDSPVYRRRSPISQESSPPRVGYLSKAALEERS